jgi:large subunit ribosomal protein L2
MNVIVKNKPTSPGRRFRVEVLKNDLHKGKPFKKLLTAQKKNGGRNNQGRITVRHQGGGSKQFYRLIDFKRDKVDVAAKVMRVEYDPNRTAHIALVMYSDGERRYIIAPKGLEIGMEVLSSVNAPIKVGNCLPLRNIPLGSTIHAVELKPKKGAQLARSAGTSTQLIAKEGPHATIRLKSGEVRKISIDCKATIGEVSNTENNLRSLGKAGARRWKGIRPTVRGVAMNPVDHPHGGGEGKTSGGRHPVSPWGMSTKGYKTRNNKRTDTAIVQRRRK